MAANELQEIAARGQVLQANATLLPTDGRRVLAAAPAAREPLESQLSLLVKQGSSCHFVSGDAQRGHKDYKLHSEVQRQQRGEDERWPKPRGLEGRQCQQSVAVQHATKEKEACSLWSPSYGRGRDRELWQNCRQ